MYEQLHIENFRGLRDLTLVGLRRINLLVGANNCGKTSVLEAVHLLASEGSFVPLVNAIDRRGEYGDQGGGDELDVTHMVHGRSVADGVSLRITGTVGGEERSFSASFQLAKNLSEKARRLGRRRVMGDMENALLLELKWTGGAEPLVIRSELSRHHGIIGDEFDSTHYSRASIGDGQTPVVEMMSTEGLLPWKVVGLYDAVSLTPDEGLVVEAMQAIEPGIERLALAKLPSREVSRAGIRLSVNGQRVPIGSMGDGMWRILGIALSVVGARGGILLVDEIDTGLHYSVLTKMWRLLLDTSRRLGVQVFATTHSRDCVDALAEIAQDNGQDISLQRIERDKSQAIPFSEAAIRRAAERGIEVR